MGSHGVTWGHMGSHALAHCAQVTWGHMGSRGGDAGRKCKDWVRGFGVGAARTLVEAWGYMDMGSHGVHKCQ
eukprot:511831-Prymnesium_polylepis.1